MKIDGPELKGVDRTVQTESMPDILDDGQSCLIINTVMRKKQDKGGNREESSAAGFTVLQIQRQG